MLINLLSSVGSYANYETYGSSYGAAYLLQWVLLIGAFAVTAIASARMKSTFKKYAKIESLSGMTGEQAARLFLGVNGLGGMPILAVQGDLTDHYDPTNKTLSLSSSTFSKTSVAAIAVAAHECGHAVQDAEGYAPLKVRSSLVPVTRIASTLSWPLILIGIFLSFRPLATFGVLLFTAVVIFQLVTLPVEFDASRRGLAMIQATGAVPVEEIDGSRKVLRAAAMTYVAALASSIMTLIRLLLITNRRR